VGHVVTAIVLGWLRNWTWMWFPTLNLINCIGFMMGAYKC